MKILSLHWGFSHGGVATYAENIEPIGSLPSVKLRSLCVLPNFRDINQKSLDSLDKSIIQINKLSSLSWTFEVRKYIAKEQPDIIFTHGFNAHFVSLLTTILLPLKVKRIVSYHGDYFPNTTKQRFMAPIYNGFTNWFLRKKADGIICVAHHTVQKLLKKNIPDYKFAVVHNGIPSYKSLEDTRETLRSEWGYDESHIIICIASRHEKIKGLEYLIEAFSIVSPKFSELRLVMIGEGTQTHALKTLVALKKLESRIQFVGQRSDVADCLSATDIFALPSLSEAHSIGLLEAMRAGKAIIATEIEGNIETVSDNKEALIVPVKDASSLSVAIEKLLKDTDLRARLGKAASKRFNSEFTVEMMRSKTTQLLKDFSNR